jgi:hypothetical protein
MSAPGFTPAPWPAPVRAAAGNWLLGLPAIAGCPKEADAHLCRAAPDMYAALEHILAGALSLPRFAEEEARAALAKARGDA